jgi:hypothetical protein
LDFRTERLSKSFTTKKNKGCVTLWTCHLHEKKYLKAKDELWELKYFTMQKHKLPRKNPLKETKILQDIIRVIIIIRVINLSYKSDKVYDDVILGSRTFGSSFNTSQKIIFQNSFHKTKPITQ